MRNVFVAALTFSAAFASFAGSASAAQDPAHPTVGMVDVPSVTVLKGLTVPQFETEMQLMTTALGVACAHCHAPRNNFASEENPRKEAARRMIAMTRAINQQFFPNYRAGPEESVLGKVTCFTCHQGAEKPRAP